MRAPTLSGPWQSRDVLHQGDSPINGPHQGAWVELENGENWFFHFQDKGVYVPHSASSAAKLAG
ncbi:hypothetical protein QYS46_32555 [Klebsiella michiganensis]|nr:hypothetical protein [Klebsiella michiganensis]